MKNFTNKLLLIFFTIFTNALLVHAVEVSNIEIFTSNPTNPTYAQIGDTVAVRFSIPSDVNVQDILLFGKTPKIVKNLISDKFVYELAIKLDQVPNKQEIIISYLPENSLGTVSFVIQSNINIVTSVNDIPKISKITVKSSNEVNQMFATPSDSINIRFESSDSSTTVSSLQIGNASPVANKQNIQSTARLLYMACNDDSNPTNNLPLILCQRETSLFSASVNSAEINRNKSLNYKISTDAEIFNNNGSGLEVIKSADDFFSDRYFMNTNNQRISQIEQNPFEGKLVLELEPQYYSIINQIKDGEKLLTGQCDAGKCYFSTELRSNDSSAMTILNVNALGTNSVLTYANSKLISLPSLDNGTKKQDSDDTATTDKNLKKEADITLPEINAELKSIPLGGSFPLAFMIDNLNKKEPEERNKLLEKYGLKLLNLEKNLVVKEFTFNQDNPSEILGDETLFTKAADEIKPPIISALTYSNNSIKVTGKRLRTSEAYILDSEGNYQNIEPQDLIIKKQNLSIKKSDLKGSAYLILKNKTGNTFSRLFVH